MNPSLSVSLTPKGVEEVKSRTYKLGMKKRSILLLLEHSRTVQFVIDKALFSPAELIEEIGSLARDGFVMVGDAIAGAASAAPAAAAPAPSAAAAGAIFIDKDVMLSEARFVMVNYCVDVFGTKADPFIEALKQCKSVEQLTACVRQIAEQTRTSFPQQMAAFQAALKQVNETAL